VPSAAGTSASDAAGPDTAGTAPQTRQVSLCVKVVSRQSSGQQGKPVSWTISAWTTGGIIPDAIISLQARPATAGTPAFSSGCGSDDGTTSCDLGSVDPDSAPRQLQATLLVPGDAKVNSVCLTITGSAPNLATAPSASAALAITAPSDSGTPATPTTPLTPSGTTASAGTATGTGTAAGAGTGTQAPGAGAGTGTQAPGAGTGAGGPSSAGPTGQQAGPTGQQAPGAASPSEQPVPAPQTSSAPAPADSLGGLPAGSSTLPAVPGLPATSPSVSPGGNASSLFPTLNPKPGASAGSGGRTSTRTRPVANTSALPESAPVLGAQVAGLIALALAFMFAVTRLSLRRRPAAAQAAAGEPGSTRSEDAAPDPPRNPENPDD
jgi:hypothetical protein